MDNTWLDESEILELYANVKANKEAILADFDAGDVTAKTLVSSHDLLVRHFDPCAYAILEMSFKEWLTKKEATK